MSRNPRVIAKCAFLIGGVLTVMIGQGPPSGKSGVGPKYTKDGELIQPTGYKAWVFCGADLGLEYSTHAGTMPRENARAKDDEPVFFHNVYIDRAAYDTYVKTKTFPDPTVLVMEVFESKQKEPRHIVSSGRYEAKRVGLEVAVKNGARPDDSKTPWAYYNFTDRSGPNAALLATAKARPDANCYQCHLEHADIDNVWVQFYPTLRDLTDR